MHKILNFARKLFFGKNLFAWANFQNYSKNLGQTFVSPSKKCQSNNFPYGNCMIWIFSKNENLVFLSPECFIRNNQPLLHSSGFFFRSGRRFFPGRRCSAIIPKKLIHITSIRTALMPKLSLFQFHLLS